MKYLLLSSAMFLAACVQPYECDPNQRDCSFNPVVGAEAPVGATESGSEAPSDGGQVGGPSEAPSEAPAEAPSESDGGKGTGGDIGDGKGGEGGDGCACDAPAETGTAFG